MRHGVERRVEGRDRQHNAKWYADRIGDAVALPGSTGEWNDIAAETAGLFRREAQRIDRAADLAVAVDGGEARLALHDCQHFAAPGGEQFSHAVEDVAAVVRCQAVRPERGLCHTNHAPDLLVRTCRHLGEWL